MWWLLWACSGDVDEDPWAPPPLPDDIEAPTSERAGLEELVGGTIDTARVGAWIGQASDAPELERRLGAAEYTPVRELVLRPGAWDDASARALAAADLPDLTALDAAGAQFSPEGFTALGGADWWSSVEHLDLAGSGLGALGAAAMKRADLRGVRSLSLARSDLDGPAIDSVLAWKLGAVGVLDLSGNSLGEAPFKALVTSARMDAVRELDLSATSPGERAAFVVATSPYIATVERLDLRDNGLTAQEWSDLKSTFGDDAIVTD
ncbi:MAG: hypothetical protein GY913_31125 [Proteobacteria bacterium]|nr:hypothetical protein [Pseudomonadota bacterium]MCP4921371.1 hypothetical protein [Pseudomonadota bacterium]